MTAVSSIILQALRLSGVIGVGQAAQQADLDDSLFQINLIFGQWSRKRWLNVDLVDVAFLSTGATSYSIGVGGDINVLRPDRIVSAFFRLAGPAPTNLIVLDGAGNPVLDGNGAYVYSGTLAPVAVGTQTFDYPLGIIDAREDYNLICVKTLSTWPRAVFYDSAYPLGRVYIWPIPPLGQFQIHLTLKCGVPAITDPSLDLALPPEYEDALLWTLCARLRPMYGLPPEPTITAAMRAALNTVRTANAQIRVMQMPSALMGRSRGMTLGGFVGGGAIYGY